MKIPNGKLVRILPGLTKGALNVHLETLQEPTYSNAIYLYNLYKVFNLKKCLLKKECKLSELFCSSQSIYNNHYVDFLCMMILRILDQASNKNKTKSCTIFQTCLVADAPVGLIGQECHLLSLFEVPMDVVRPLARITKMI